MTGRTIGSIIGRMIPPVVLAVAHLAILVALCVGLGISAMPSRMARGRHRGVRYRRLTDDQMLKRLLRGRGEPKR